MKCALRNKIIYVRSEGYYSPGRAQAIFQDLTLLECANQCTSKVQGVNCTSFEYDTMQLRCVLKEDSGSLMDNNSSMSPLKTVHSTALFRQFCLPEEGICPLPYTFEHLPGHVLMGIANEVMQVGSVEECLSICVTAKKVIEIECRSVVYYYDTGECILNNENRATSAAMITNDTMNMRVDYFENRCYDVQCLTDFTVHWIKVGRFTISDKLEYTVIKQVTKEQCFNYCLENKINDQPFPCKLYAYSESKMICHLTSESGLTHSTTSDDNNQKISDDDLDNYDYNEKICLKGAMRCQDISFEHISHHALLNIGNKVVTTSMTSCLEICLRSGNQCNSVMYFHDKDECVLSRMTQHSTDEQLRYFPEVDYFDNVCDYKIAINMSMENKMIEMSTPTMYKQLDGLETECGAAGILISVLFSKPTVGAIFIKDHFATCRSEFSNTMNATMEIALSTLRQDNPPCPGYETNPSIWSFIVVVQKNGLGIPELMTDKDQVFNITCDYSNGQTTSNSVQDRILLQEPSRDWSSIPASNDHVQLTVFRGDQPVSTAVMGELLEMRWTVVQDRTDNVGLFVNRCIAERLDGTPPLPPPLTLIADGCIDSKVKRVLMQYPIIQFDGGLRTKIKVFRFDGSRRVRILCSVDICIEECLPVTCDKEISGSLPNSDKKKRETFTSRPQQTSAQQIKRQLITGTFTIVEENVDLVLNESATKIDEQLLNMNNEGSCNIISAPQRIYFGHEEYCPVESHAILSKIIRQKDLK